MFGHQKNMFSKSFVNVVYLIFLFLFPISLFFKLKIIENSSVDSSPNIKFNSPYLQISFKKYVFILYFVDPKMEFFL